MNKKLPIIQLSGFEKRKKTDCYGFGTQAFVIAFVYADTGNCVVKGMCQEVEDYIKKHFPRCIYNLTLWADGKSRNIWGSTRSIYIFHKQDDNDRLKYDISIYKNGKRHSVACVRRVPHKWLDIYNDADPKR